MNSNEVAQLIAVVKARYGNKFQANPATTQAWSMVLDDVSYADAMAVLPAWLKQEEWAPDPAQIRSTVMDRTCGLPSPDEAWQMVEERVRSTYPGQPAPDWSAPQIVQEALKEIGGSWAVRRSEKPEDIRRRFIGAYSHRRRVENQMMLDEGERKALNA